MALKARLRMPQKRTGAGASLSHDNLSVSLQRENTRVRLERIPRHQAGIESGVKCAVGIEPHEQIRSVPACGNKRARRINSGIRGDLDLSDVSVCLVREWNPICIKTGIDAAVSIHPQNMGAIGPMAEKHLTVRLPCHGPRVGRERRLK